MKEKATKFVENPLDKTRVDCWLLAILNVAKQKMRNKNNFNILFVKTRKLQSV